MTKLADLQAMNLSIHSHKSVNVECELRVSAKCRGNYNGAYRDLLIACMNHGNNVACFHCSRIVKASHVSKGMGRTNPNTKYKTLDDSFFKRIDTPNKAYLLGWIASDGCVTKRGFSIKIHAKDIECLNKLRDIICKELPIKVDKVRASCKLEVSSKEMSIDICGHLGIEHKKKSKCVKFPTHLDEDLKWHFLRGLFDGDGSISDPRKSAKTYPVANISSSSVHMKEEVSRLTGINLPPSSLIEGKCANLYWYNNNALDFLSKLYERDGVGSSFLKRKRDLFLMWSSWIPSLSGANCRNVTDNHIKFKWAKTVKEAVKPSKSNATDSGYDLTIIKLDKKIGEKVYLYDTGVKITPDFGWYFDLVPRSSMIKSGYILANSVGVIDRTYVGTVKVPLIKIDETMPDIELPTRLVQIIPRPIVHMETIEVDDLDSTNRGTGGFGSTNK